MQIHKVSVANKTQGTVTLTQAQEDQIIADEIPVSVTEISTKRSELSGSDSQMARVTEDLIQILIDKGTIAMSDFSTEAQAVITDREQLRDDIAGA